MSNQDYPQVFLDRLQAIKSKRARTVIDHILQHGSITTEDLKNVYGYEHPPRAIADVKEQGITLESFAAQNAQGRTIRGYKFGDASQIHGDDFEGRKQFSKAFKEQLLEQTGSRCAICLTQYDKRYLQIDHRVPYHVAGELSGEQRDTNDYMLLCRSCNRAKSWSCEHCLNWLELKSVEVCHTCYWASPDTYKHIALQVTRRLELVWTEQDVETFEQLRRNAEAAREAMPEYVKTILKQHLKQ